MKNKNIKKIMEKSKKVDVQNVQNKGDGVPIPNASKKQLPKAKLHIKIPFFKNSQGKRSPEICKDPRLSQSLPSESHMPSNIHDPSLYHVCDECKSPLESSVEEECKSCSPFLPDKAEDVADSEKHQSDLEENEKDSDNETAKGDCRQDNTDSELPSSELSPKEKDPKEDGKEQTPVTQCCLKSCLKKSGGRRRANTFPGLEQMERHVSFSPDTVEPRARTCKYREWIERHSMHPKCPPINIKHEKRKCQLNQMRKVNISDYMSRSYGSSFYNPIGSFGGDMLM